MKNKTFAMNGSHDCSFTFIDKNQNLRIYEYERFVKKRYAGFTATQEHVLYGTNDEQRRNFLSFLKERLYDPQIETILHHDLHEPDFKLLKEFFPLANFIYKNHHESHAYSAAHGSEFKKCLVFSIDGGGHDYGRISMTNVFLYDNGNLQLLEKSDKDFGSPYRFSSFFISEIPSPGAGDLSESGKFMGLSAYGEFIPAWENAFIDFYKNGSTELLAYKLGIPHVRKHLSGKISYDFAATSQKVFENELFKFILPYIEKYKLNVVMTGGCALNVLFNQKLFEYLKKINLSLYVPPNPNDCGLSYGMFVSHFPDHDKKETAFSGIEILDEFKINQFTNPHDEFSYSKLIDLLKEGKIIGLINGNSEVGPRALGNRSIICYPAFQDMKDILNKKVKFREWFRPFAPVCKLEDKDKYFENSPVSPYMSYAPRVKSEFRIKLPSITHVDGTARLQTVDKGNIFYEILDEMSNHQDLIPVILNTSFNIKGFPILTTLEDAFYVLNNTEMDYLIFDNKIFRK